MDLIASSAVNLPNSNASLGLLVIWIGVGSTRCTFSGARVPPRYFYDKFDVFHFLSPFCESAKKATIHFFEVEYIAAKGLPHSKQFARNRGVINPQDGHILCGRNPVSCGVTLRIQWASRIVSSTINKPKEILVAFIKVTLSSRSCTRHDGQTAHSLEKALRWENFRWTGLGQRT
jgi:hypothetical protein